jgi:hypothetical protein
MITGMGHHRGDEEDSECKMRADGAKEAMNEEGRWSWTLVGLSGPLLKRTHAVYQNGVMG